MNYHGTQLRSTPRVFRNAAFAADYVGLCAKLHLVVMGRPGEFLVVTPVDGERLTRAGYAYL